MTESLEVLLDAHALLGECPLWDDLTGTLLWVDILRHEVHRLDPATGLDRSLTLAEPVGAVALREGGGLVAAAGMSFGELDEDSGAFTKWHQVSRGDRMNDGACDPAGRFWAGTMTNAQTPGAASLYALDPSTLQVTEKLHDVTLSNGLAWSPDAEILYYVDTVCERIEAFDYDTATAALSGRRTVVDLHDIDGRPDGLTVDSEGRLWVAMAKGRVVRCYNADAALQHVVSIPAPIVTSCTFGGDEFGELYVTTGEWPATPAQLLDYPNAGAIFRLTGLGASGLPANRFAG